MHIHYKKLQMTCEGSLQVPLTHFTFSLVPDSSDGQVEMAQQIKIQMQIREPFKNYLADFVR